jgi:hypothetical protein
LKGLKGFKKWIRINQYICLMVCRCKANTIIITQEGRRLKLFYNSENDYHNGMLSANTLKEIILNKLYGSFTALRILSNMQQKK